MPLDPKAKVYAESGETQKEVVDRLSGPCAYAVHEIPQSVDLYQPRMFSRADNANRVLSGPRKTLTSSGISVTIHVSPEFVER